MVQAWKGPVTQIDQQIITHAQFSIVQMGFAHICFITCTLKW